MENINFLKVIQTVILQPPLKKIKHSIYPLQSTTVLHYPYWHTRIDSILKLKYCPSKEND